VLSDEQVERALVITAHPDDVDFGAAGTVAGWTAAGIAVSYCICTDGDAGGFDPDVPRDRIPAIRRNEQVAAAAELGVTDVVFLGYPDGDLEVTQDLRRDISREIRRVRPQRVLTQFPQRNFHRIGASHPDHMAAGEATLRAVYPDARNPFAHPTLLADEGLLDWKVEEVWLMGGEEAGHAVDITDRFAAKQKALLSHASQLSGAPAELEARLREWNGATAREAGLPEGRLAEAFQVMEIPF
ncbi:MAG TPA: PIG-L deacetylase family protein, partial [Frankiaceae bacterium]